MQKVNKSYAFPHPKQISRTKFYDIIRHMYQSNDQVTPAETAEILRLAEQSLKTEGDFVELGCYRGDTSVLLGKMLQNATPNSQNCGKPVENLCKTPKKTAENLWKTLWIYDSFAGLPEKTAADCSGAGQNFQKGELLVSKRAVIEKLRKHNLKIASHPDPSTSTVVVKKAWFDDLMPQDLPDEIAFAFLDGDLYQSIRTSLRLVAPRLSAPGIMIVHDYNNPELPGSARAVDEFLRTHPGYQLRQQHTLAIITRKC